MSEHALAALRSPARPGTLRISLAVFRCVLRGLPRFFSSSPKTPLRVLGTIAFDTLYLLRTSRPLPEGRIDELAAVLDFLGWTNAAWDQKDLCRAEYDAARTWLHTAGLGTHIDRYLTRLCELESCRPRVGGDHRRFGEVREYREAVARLCVGTAAAVALDAEQAQDGIPTTGRDDDVEALLRILLQSQIIDDVMDYPGDLSAALPTFLTATASLPQALELTSAAAHSYGARREGARSGAIFPFRIALALFTAAAAIVVRFGEWRYRHDPNLEAACRRAGT